MDIKNYQVLINNDIYCSNLSNDYKAFIEDVDNCLKINGTIYYYIDDDCSKYKYIYVI